MRIADARRQNGGGDTDVLLAALLHKDRSWLLAHDDELLSDENAETFLQWIVERSRGVPAAYIIGQKEFFGRTFFVDRSTLIPRPATETLVEETLRCLDGGVVGTNIIEADTGIVIARNIWKNLDDVDCIVDIGTGTGCIAITLACERPSLHGYASDVSNEALTIAAKNVRQYCAKVELRAGDLLKPFHDLTEPFLLVSNPPYVANEALLADDVRDHEPRSALMGGGEDGADLLRTLVSQAKAHPFCHGMIVECLQEQAGIATQAY